MGYSRKRAGRDGRPRYTAYYGDAKDRERSAGTFPNKKDADRAWQRAEAKVAEGRLGDPGRGRQTLPRSSAGRGGRSQSVHWIAGRLSA